MSSKTINARIMQKRDTDANWQSKNPVLLDGEIILVDMSDGELRAKIGDGAKGYNSLPFSDEPLRNLISALDTKIGDESVALQISEAITPLEEGKASTDHTHPVDNALSSTSTNPVQNKVVFEVTKALINGLGEEPVADQITAAKADCITELSVSGQTVTYTKGDGSTGTINTQDTDTVYTHPDSGVAAGTYKSVTVNAAGHVTGGSNPTTLSGYGITDAATKSELNTLSDLVGDTEVSVQISDAIAEIPTPDVSGQIATHNSSASAHSDIRTSIGNKMDKTNPSGTGSFSMNRKANTTIGSYSHAEGYETTASGEYGSHAEGITATASGRASHAEGRETTASEMYSHAEGFCTTASGLYSHVEGGNATASGTASHAEGKETTASGQASHAEGYGTTASSDYQHAQGKYNIADTANKYAHIVGNGNSSSAPSNAHTIDWNGLGWFKGGLKVGGTGQDDSAAKEVATKDYVNSAIPDVSGQINTHNSSTSAHSDIRNSISNLSSLVGDTAVSTQISNAIANISGGSSSGSEKITLVDETIKYDSDMAMHRITSNWAPLYGEIYDIVINNVEYNNLQVAYSIDGGAVALFDADNSIFGIIRDQTGTYIYMYDNSTTDYSFKVYGRKSNMFFIDIFPDHTTTATTDYVTTTLVSQVEQAFDDNKMIILRKHDDITTYPEYYTTANLTYCLNAGWMYFTQLGFTLPSTFKAVGISLVTNDASSSDGKGYTVTVQSEKTITTT